MRLTVEQEVEYRRHMRLVRVVYELQWHRLVLRVALVAMTAVAIIGWIR